MMMRPPLFMCLSAACVATSVPRTLMSMTRSISSSVVSSNVFGMAVPALFTSTSSRPKIATALSTAPSTALASAASAWIATAFPPPSSIALTTAEAALASFTYVMATLAPSAARRFAMAAPMPREPPVMSATFSFNLDMGSPLSARGLAAVGGEHLASHERSLGGRQEHDGASNLLRLADAPQRHTRGQRRLPLRGAGEAVKHCGLGRTGRHGVDPHAEARGLERRGLRHALDGVLAGSVDGCAGRSFVAIGRGDVDDAAAPLSLHHAQLMLNAEQRPEHVGVEGGSIGVGVLLRHRTGLAFGAGVVDGRVQPTKPRDGLIDQVPHLVLVAHIRAQEFDVSAERAQLSREFLAG